MSDIAERINAALAGRYTIERKLGEGGMATVYLSRDLKHNRNVALKVLKPELAAVVGAERFLAEIETTANLQHPHILPLFDSGEADGFLYYVMPYVEGPSLRDRLDEEKQLPIDEATRIATDVAEALDYAHRLGVVHRDIKPPNILLQAGTPVIADFGISLALGAGAGRLTETGLSLGTPHYMSPEQATGDLNVGPQTDIYALGCVLYEMLIGEPPFTGSTPQAILGKIIVGEAPSVTAERPAVPPNVDAAVRTAIAKTPADRFKSIGRFAEAMNDPAYRAATTGITDPLTRGRVGRYLWPATIAASLILAMFMGTRRPPPLPVVTAQITLPEDQRFGVRGGRTFLLDVSRDGSKIVYVGDVAGEMSLYVRRLDSFDFEPIEGTEGARQPFFDPTGEEVGFFQGEALRRVPVSGGSPITVAEVPDLLLHPGGGRWGDDGTIVFAAGRSVYRVRVTGEDLEEFPLPTGLLGPPTGGRALWPELLPDTRHVLVTAPTGVWVLDPANGEYSFLFDGLQARYLSTGHLLYNGGQEQARLIEFDLGKLETIGAPFPAEGNVFRGPGSGALNMAVSQNGLMVFVRGGFERTLVLVDRSGREVPVDVEPRGYRFPRISTDGRFLAVTVDPRPSDLWVVDLDTELATARPTPSSDGWGVWSPDGGRLATYDGGSDRPHLWISDYPFVGAAQPVPGEHESLFPLSWARDGRILAVGGDRNLYAIDASTGTVDTLMATEASEGGPRISPSGRWLAFVSDETGQDEVYVTAYPRLGPQYPVSQGGGSDPSWSGDDGEIFYRRGNSIIAQGLRASEPFAITGDPEVLFTRPYNFFQQANWIARPQGDFVMIRSDPTNTRQFQIVQNWFDWIEAR